MGSRVTPFEHEAMIVRWDPVAEVGKFTLRAERVEVDAGIAEAAEVAVLDDDGGAAATEPTDPGVRVEVDTGIAEAAEVAVLDDVGGAAATEPTEPGVRDDAGAGGAEAAGIAGRDEGATDLGGGSATGGEAVEDAVPTEAARRW